MSKKLNPESAAFTPEMCLNAYKKFCKIKIEVHADGVKEVPDECPFCDIPCKEPHCPYTKEEQ